MAEQITNSATYWHGSHTTTILAPISLYKALTIFPITWTIYVCLINGITLVRQYMNSVRFEK